jgi:hypothetical protein
MGGSGFETLSPRLFQGRTFPTPFFLDNRITTPVYSIQLALRLAPCEEDFPFLAQFEGTIHSARLEDRAAYRLFRVADCTSLSASVTPLEATLTKLIENKQLHHI